MPKLRPKALEIAERRKEVARLRIEAKTQVEIAEELGVHEATIRRDIEALLTEWKEARLDDTEEARAIELRLLTASSRLYQGR